LPPDPPPDHRAGFVALVGRPNVGKSTLLNALLDQKLSIVTPTPQTTRQRILGVLSRRTYQLVFLDTPGMLEPRYELQRRMLDQAFAAIGDADVILALVEARTPVRRRELELLGEVVGRAGERPVVAVLNKIDRVARPALLPMMAALGTLEGIAEIVPVSALEADGVPELEAVIARHLPPSPPYFPPDTLSDQPERFFVAELIREKVFRLYGEEIPYSTAVMIVAFEEHEGRKLQIRAEIVVERDSQKGILIGQGGRALKRVGSAARGEIERFLGRPVYLELWARVRRRWRSDPRFLRELGL
jgi:GTP-binding protein Era